MTNQFRFGKAEGGSYLGSGDALGGIDTLNLPYTYVTPLEAPSPMSASIREATPTTPDAQSQVLRVNNTASAKVYALVDEDIDARIGVGAQILHADLLLYKAAAWTSGAKTIDVHVVTESWDSESVTWNNAPTVGDSVSASVDGAGAAGDLIEVDVTSLVQAAVASRDAGLETFYGFRISTTSTDDLTFAAAFSTQRPTLKVEPSVPPNAPEDLLPNGGRAVSETLPLLDSRFRDNDAEDVVSAGQWRISTTEEMDSLVYDSGEVNVTSAQFDLNDPPAGAAAVTPLSEATPYFWDVKLRDSHGLWSDFSDVAEFQVIAKGTLTLDAPASSTVTSPTPTFSFTFTPAGAETQQSVEWDLEVFRDGLWRSHWLYRRTVTSATEVTLPDAYALSEGENYRLTVRVWDDVNREDYAGDRSFLSDSQIFELEGVSV